MTEIDGVTFPEPTNWITDIDRLNVVGETLLTACYAGLKLYDKGDRYERRFVGHGLEAPQEPSRANQLTIVLTKIALGQAGSEQFQFVRGAQGSYGYQTASYVVEISSPYPKRQGTTALPTPQIAEFRATLWQDGLIVFGTLLGIALGAVVLDPALNLASDGVQVGPMTPKGPAGGNASWQIEVAVAL